MKEVEEMAKNGFPLLDADTFGEKMDILSAAVASLRSERIKANEVMNFKDLHELIARGAAPANFLVGGLLDIPVNMKLAEVSKASGLTISFTHGGKAFYNLVREYIENKEYTFTKSGNFWLMENKAYSNEELKAYDINVSGSAEDGAKFIIKADFERRQHIILGFDHETVVHPKEVKHSMTLFPLFIYEKFIYNDSQASHYFPDGLQPGNYSFGIGNYDNDYGGNKTYYFTLQKPIPAGGQLRFGWSWHTQVTANKVATYASNKVSETIESGITISESGAPESISLGVFENGPINKDFTTSNGVKVWVNTIERVRYGSNGWDNSWVLQWMNSDKESGWWAPSSEFDRPASWVTTTPGYLYMLPDELVRYLGECSKLTDKNRICDGGETISHVLKAWLLSNYELQSPKSTTPGQITYDYFKAIRRTEGDWQTNPELIKRNEAGAPQYWWLRAPYTSNTNYVRHVYTSGGVHNYDAYSTSGVPAAFAII